MRRLVKVSLLSPALVIPTWVFAQTPQTPPPQPSSGASTTSEEVRPATATTSGDTGFWFVPTAEVLLHKKWSASFQRTNMDDGQGFSDFSTFPLTFGVGVGGHAEVFGSWSLITRINRDTDPLFFTSTSKESDTGTGGGLIPGYPLNRMHWTGNQLGEFWVGGKYNFMAEADHKRASAAVRAMIKFPTGQKEPEGTTSGKTDFAFDGIVSKRTKNAEVSGYAGFMFRGNPSGYELTNGFRWGFGAEFPGKTRYGLKIVTELFGESVL